MPNEKKIRDTRVGPVEVSGIWIIEREDAAIGVFISLESPTKPMRTEAASAGFYETKDEAILRSTKHPRLQLRTVGELLEGKTIDCPPYHTNLTLRKAPKAKKKSKRQKDLFD